MIAALLRGILAVELIAVVFAWLFVVPFAKVFWIIYLAYWFQILFAVVMDEIGEL